MKMKIFGRAMVVALLLLHWAKASDIVEKLKGGFVAPPVEARPETWWHWSSLFVTPAGITADLESMKEIGYSGAHVFAPSMSTPPPVGWPQILTPEWRELLKHAASEAKRLGLKLGVHNCPGWSSSGGPWIKPEDSMQCLVGSSLEVTGPKEGPFKLAQPATRHDYYRDIEVYAFPSQAPMPRPDVDIQPRVENPSALVDGDSSTFVSIPIKQEGDRGTVTLSFPEPYEAQFAQIKFRSMRLYLVVEVEISDDGRSFRKVGSLSPDANNVKLDPKLISLGDNPVKAKIFRFNFVYRSYPSYASPPKGVEVDDIRLLALPMIADIDRKNSSANLFSYSPPRIGYANAVGIDASKMLRLGKYLKPDGTLEWNAPNGNWTILRIGHTSTGAQNAPASLRGLECDKLSKRGLDAHWPHMMGIILDDLKETGVLKYATIDSYEVGGQNWTQDFAKEFQKRRGYDLMPYLPVALGYVVGTPAESARFLYDFQRTVSDLFAENYYDYFTELCHRNGLIAITEAYGGPFDNLRCSRNADIPTGEFWIGKNWRSGLAQSSIANFHGRLRVGAESFTTEALPGRWLQDPRQLKEYGDRAWAGGVNMLIMHSFVHQPLLNVRPGVTLGRHGAHLNRNNTWWKYGNGWTDYIARSQFLLMQGRKVADLLILSGEGHPRSGGTAVAGYGVDLCSWNDLMEKLKCVDGRLVAPSGTTYEALSLGKDRNLSLSTLKKIVELLEAGATVGGLRPLGSPTLMGGAGADAEYATLVSKLWGEKPVRGSVRKIGQGRLIVTDDSAEMLRLAGVVPDFKVATGINILHRRVDDVDIYFTSNDSDLYYNGDLSFRVENGKSPEFWKPLSGAIEPVAVWRSGAGYVSMPLQLAPHESTFVVFTPSKAKPVLAAFQPWEEMPRLEIVKAVYRGQGDSSGRDVTEQVRKLLTPSGLDFKVSNSLLGGDPAHNRVKELWVEYRCGDQSGEIISREGKIMLLSPRELARGVLRIQRAIYRATGEENGLDVTEKVRSLVGLDGLVFEVGNLTLGGDPAHNRTKELVLEYELNGKVEHRLAQERETLVINTLFQENPPVATVEVTSGIPYARFACPGVTDVLFADGSHREIASGALPPAIELDTDWHLTFPPDLGAPASVELPKLISWSEHPDSGIKYFSGTANYSREFELPSDFPVKNQRLVLDLGEVRNLAEVELNGQKVALLWTPPFACDVTEYARPGQNKLSIRVTNLLVNRQIGDEQCKWQDEMVGNSSWPKWVLEDKPRSESGRLTWGTWKGWTAEDAPLPSGLLGPVRLRTEVLVPITDVASK